MGLQHPKVRYLATYRCEDNCGHEITQSYDVKSDIIGNLNDEGTMLNLIRIEEVISTVIYHNED